MIHVKHQFLFVLEMEITILPSQQWKNMLQQFLLLAFVRLCQSLLLVFPLIQKLPLLQQFQRAWIPRNWYLYWFPNKHHIIPQEHSIKAKHTNRVKRIYTFNYVKDGSYWSHNGWLYYNLVTVDLPEEVI